MPRRGRSPPPLHSLDRVLVAVHVLFQLPQNREPLPGGIQLTAKALFGIVGLVQRGPAVFQLQFQTRADVGQLLFVFFHHPAVADSIVQILLCLVPPGSLFLHALLEGGQALAGGLLSGFGGGLCHLCFGALRGQGGQLFPQGVLPRAAGGALVGQMGDFLIQSVDLSRQLFALGFHGLCHGAVALQGGFGFGTVLLPVGDLLPQGSRALLVA